MKSERCRPAIAAAWAGRWGRNVQAVLGTSRLRVLLEILRCRQEGRPPPSRRDLARLMGMPECTNAVTQLLTKLAADGLVRWDPMICRALVPTCRLVILPDRPETPTPSTPTV